VPDITDEGEAFMSALMPWSCQVLDQGQVLLDV
jgi:hypothetical protein